MGFQEEIMIFMEKAEALLDVGKIEEGIAEFENAKQIAKDHKWEQKVLEIDTLIDETYKKEQERLEKSQEIEKLNQLKKKREQKQKSLHDASLRIKAKEEEEKRKKLQELAEKKKRDEEAFYQGIDLLEEGNNLILKKDFVLGLEKFNDALNIFKDINSEAEIIRVKELIEDANVKKEEYEKNQAKIKEEEAKRKKESEEEKSHRQILERLEKEKKEQERKAITSRMQQDASKETEMNEAFAQMDQGMIRIKDRKYDEAIEFYRSASNIFKRLGEENEYNKTLLQITKFKEEKEEYLALQAKAKDTSKEDMMKEAYSHMDVGIVKAKDKKYEEAIKLFHKAHEIFHTLGETNEAKKTMEQINIFRESIKTIELEQKKIKELEAKSKKEAEELEKELQVQKKIQEKLKQEKKEKEKVDQSKKQKQDTDYKNALKIVEAAEAVGKAYDEEVRNGKILELTCPYNEIIEEYKKAHQMLLDVDLEFEANSMYQGIERYTEKLKNDEKIRADEQEKILKKKEEEAEYNKLIQDSKIMDKIKESEKAKLEKQEMNKKQKQDSNYKNALKIVEAAEAIGRTYDDEVRNGKILELTCPYNNIIEEYKKAHQMLLDVNLDFEANSMYQGIERYTEKLKNDEKIRAVEQEKIRKKKEEEAEYNKLIHESKLKDKMQESEKAKLEKQEIDKKRQDDKRLQDALLTLEEADALLKDKKYDEALKIFNSALSIFELLQWDQGKNLVHDSIDSAKRLKEQDDYLKKQMAEKAREQAEFNKIIEEKKREMQKLKEEEQNLKHSAELKRKKTQEYETTILENIITASELTEKKEFDQAIKILEETLSYCDIIEWKLKRSQIEDLIENVEIEKDENAEKEREEKILSEKSKQQQKLFDEQIERIRQERLEKEQRERAERKKQMSKKEFENNLSNQAYQFIDQGERQVIAKQYYSALLEFKKAVMNFNEIEWERESSIAKNRAIQIVAIIPNCLINFNELSKMQDVGLMSELMKYLDAMEKNIIQKEFDLAVKDLERAAKICAQNKMTESFNLIQEAIENVQNEKAKYEERINKPREGTDEEKAFGLLEKSKFFEKEGRYGQSIRLAKEALGYFKRLKFAREIESTEIKIRALEREMIRREETVKKLQDSIKSKEDQELSEEEKLKKIIEQRREERLKKRMGEN